MIKQRTKSNFKNTQFPDVTDTEAKATEEMDTSSQRPKAVWVPQFRVNSWMNVH